MRSGGALRTRWSRIVLVAAAAALVFVSAVLAVMAGYLLQGCESRGSDREASRRGLSWCAVRAFGAPVVTGRPATPTSRVRARRPPGREFHVDAASDAARDVLRRARRAFRPFDFDGFLTVRA